jgi:lipoprotein-anchoring transpeptidase ErfK/SrfK
MALACLAGVASAAPTKEIPTKEIPAKEADTKAEAAKTGDAPALTREAIDAAVFAAGARPEETGKEAGTTGNDRPDSGKQADDKRPDPLLVKVQVLLDRAHFSPGAIDGRDGENLRGALSAFAVANGLPAATRLNAALFDTLKATSTDPVAVDYTLTEADVAGPYVSRIPPKMEDQADLEALGYADPREMLAERFHMAPSLLAALNPDKAFDKAGTVIAVAAVPPLETDKPSAEDRKRVDKDVVRITVDKEARHVRAFDKAGRLVAFYPASIGSEEKPAPSGQATVKGVAFAPTYTYNPKYAFKGVKTKETFTIRPGPNNPVGVAWIDLSIPSYGIHGTPEPEKVGKTESHGCIRLTNWDVRDLAGRVEPGVKVTFADD